MLMVLGWSTFDLDCVGTKGVMGYGWVVGWYGENFPLLLDVEGGLGLVCVLDWVEGVRFCKESD